MIAYVDGAWVDADRAVVPISDRGFLLGDGVFDTCRVFEGAWFRFREHAERLRASGALLRIDVPEAAVLQAIAQELLDRNRDAATEGVGAFHHAVLRLMVTRGSGGKGLATAGAGPVRVVATLRALSPDWLERAGRGWSVITANVRHPPARVMPPALKGQARIASLLARLEAEAAGCDDALILGLDGTVTEGTTWNVFWRHRDRLRTPGLETGALAGVTRELVLELAAASGYQVQEGSWPRSELDSADEVFATMTSLGLVPVRRLDGRQLPASGEAVGRLTTPYWDRVREESRG